MSDTLVCKVEEIVTNTGVCALIHGEQVSVFRVLENGKDRIYAVSNYDPFSNANVLSRGLIGSINGETVVASPIYKQHFSLQTGVCVEDESIAIQVWEVFLEENCIWVRARSIAA